MTTCSFSFDPYSSKGENTSMYMNLAQILFTNYVLTQCEMDTAAEYQPTATSSCAHSGKCNHENTEAKEVTRK